MGNVYIDLSNVYLCNVYVGHGEELLQPRLVVLLDGAEDSGQDKVVILGSRIMFSSRN
jgi:hypothetical protein